MVNQSHKAQGIRVKGLLFARRQALLKSTYKINPIANEFPEMRDDEFQALVKDIEANGLREQIDLDGNGDILDGRHRERACRQALRPQRLMMADGSRWSPRKWKGPKTQKAYIAHVIAKNLHRRHTPMIGQQRAALIMLLGKKYLDKAGGDRRSNRNGCGLISQENVAKQAETSVRTVELVGQAEKAAPGSLEKIAAGKTTAGKVLADIEAMEEIGQNDGEFHDCFGNRLPARVAETFQDGTILEAYRKRAYELKISVQRLCDEQNAMATFIVWNVLRADFQAIERALQWAMPYCLCNSCGGDGCQICKTMGWLPKDVYERQPRELAWPAR